MTETGYRSWFGAPADVKSEGGPVESVRLWLEYETGPIHGKPRRRRAASSRMRQS
jgi:hypothetical protein